jgi:hypothetical protein
LQLGLSTQTPLPYLGKHQINAFDRNREPRHARISAGMVRDVVLGYYQSSA